MVSLEKLTERNAFLKHF